VRAVYSFGTAATTHKFLLLFYCYYDIAPWVSYLYLGQKYWILILILSGTWARKERVAGYSPAMYKILVDAIIELRTYN